MGRREDHEPDGRAAVLPGLAQLVADGPHRHRPVLGLDHDPQVAAARDPRVDGQDEVALLGLHDGAGVVAGPVQEVAGAAGEVAEHRLEQVLEVAALRGRPGALGAAGGGGRLDRDEPLLEPLNPAAISSRNWCIGESSRVGSRSVASLEASPSKYVSSIRPIRPMALSRFFSSNSSSTMPRSAPRSPRNCSSVRGSRPSPSAKLVRRVCSSVAAAPLVDLLGLADEPLELAADDVHVDGDAGVLEREQADAQGALDDGRAVVAGTVGQVRGERRVAEDEALDHDAVAVDADPGGQRRRLGGDRAGRERADDGGIHGPNGAPDP